MRPCLRPDHVTDQTRPCHRTDHVTEQTISQTRPYHRPHRITQIKEANCPQIVFNDMGSELTDPSSIATPLRPAEMFKVVDLEKATA